MKTMIAENVGKYSGQPLEELLTAEAIRDGSGSWGNKSVRIMPGKRQSLSAY